MNKKGQAFETLGFIVLAVAFIIVFTLLKTASTKGYVSTTKELYEIHEGEGFRAGINAILQMTEKRTGKSMIELLGIASLLKNDTIYFGPTIGSINITEELKKRFDAIYGKNHWHFKIPFGIPPQRDIQIIVVADVSGSMCDDVYEFKKVPEIINVLRAQGKSVSMRLFLLPGQLMCCQPIGTITCASFPSTAYFDCKSLSTAKCSLKGQTDEDWGNGLACAIEEGPKNGWNNYSIKVGIPISDELPGGSETCTKSPSSAQYQSLQNGINAAKKIGMYVFPFKAVTGKECCPSCNCGYKEGCGICYSGRYLFTSTQCRCDETLEYYMSTIANETKGEMIKLKDASEIVDKIIGIVGGLNITGIPHIEAGYPIPKEKNIRAVTTAIPTPAKDFVVFYAYQWS